MDMVVTDAEKNGVNSLHSPEKAAKLAAQVLGPMLLHSSCAGEELSTIATTIATEDPEILFERVRKLAPDLRPERLEHTINTYRLLLENNVIRPTSDAAAHMEQGENPITRLPLVGGPHVASDIIISHTRNNRFDSDRAFHEGNPAYHINVGDIPYLAEPLSVVTALDADDFTISSLVRHAATTLHLPHPTGEEFQFHLV